MKYLLAQILVLLLALILLYYFSTLPDFLPFQESGEPDWSRIGIVMVTIFFAIESFVALTLYLFQKFIAYGWKEYPPKGVSLRWGIGSALGLSLVMVLHIIHAISLSWGLVIMLAIIAIIMIL